MSNYLYEDASLQDWICIKIKNINIFFNVIERIITYHPPFLLEDLENFLVRYFLLYILEAL
jgi:hypothetical protein